MKNKKTLIFLVAETGAGKDTVANKLPWPKVVSYTTRERRKNVEQPGVQHHFISDEEMDVLEEQEALIAWTRTGNIRYCATARQLKDDVSIYIINPDGVRWFNENYKGPELRFITIGLYAPLEVRKSRCRLRSDFDTVFMKRVADEQEDYNKFRLDGEFDYMIKNEDSNLTANIIYKIVNTEIGFKNSNSVLATYRCQ